MRFDNVVSLRTILILILGFFFYSNALAQPGRFDRFQFLIGEWQGTGTGFGNSKSEIKLGCQYIMDSTYIEINTEAKFEATKENPDGVDHFDKGILSFDESRMNYVLREFHLEGYVNQYVLIKDISSDSVYIFENE